VVVLEFIVSSSEYFTQAFLYVTKIKYNIGLQRYSKGNFNIGLYLHIYIYVYIYIYVCVCVCVRVLVCVCVCVFLSSFSAKCQVRD
jgi:hypothetical protein